ncbi:MAG: hypothetical protein M3137_02840, partial [Actinomycetota bacterium]|nr:hypothetical protein [Actinomycetota bacterium]
SWISTIEIYLSTGPMSIPTHQEPSGRNVDQYPDSNKPTKDLYESVRHQAKDGSGESDGKGENKQ